MIFQAVATPIPDVAVETPADNMVNAELAGNALGEPESSPSPESANINTPVLTISIGKKNAGQIMFDFGGTL